MLLWSAAAAAAAAASQDKAHAAHDANKCFRKLVSQCRRQETAMHVITRSGTRMRRSLAVRHKQQHKSCLMAHTDDGIRETSSLSPALDSHPRSSPLLCSSLSLSLHLAPLVSQRLQTRAPGVNGPDSRTSPLSCTMPPFGARCTSCIAFRRLPGISSFSCRFHLSSRGPGCRRMTRIQPGFSWCSVPAKLCRQTFRAFGLLTPLLLG